MTKIVTRLKSKTWKLCHFCPSPPEAGQMLRMTALKEPRVSISCNDLAVQITIKVEYKCTHTGPFHMTTNNSRVKIRLL